MTEQPELLWRLYVGRCVLRSWRVLGEEVPA